MQEEWLEWRRQGIGASDAAVILNVFPWKSRIQLWKEKLGLWEQPDNAYMARGRALEDEALGAFMMETGFFLTSQVRKVHKDYEWMRATLDGWNEEDKVLVEIKTSKEIHEEIPRHYYPQVQHQMEVVGVDSMYYFSYDGNRGKSLKIEKNPEFIENMIEEEKRFWDWVQKGFLDLKEDEEFNYHMSKIAEIKALKKELSEQEGFHLSQLILFSDGCPAQGKGGMLYNAERKGSIDYLSIPELKDLDLEPYRKPSTTYWQVKTGN